MHRRVHIESSVGADPPPGDGVVSPPWQRAPGPPETCRTARGGAAVTDLPRKAVVRSSEGIWECSFVGECSAVCPKGVDPAKAIQQTKFDTTMRFVLPYGNRDE